jgi:hypothetical protein
MKKDYTNANKRFYDKNQPQTNKGRKDKKYKIKAHLLIYIFNNLEGYKKLINELIEEEKRIMDYYNFSSRFIILNNYNTIYRNSQDSINLFFKDLKSNYYNESIYTIYNLFDKFIIEEGFSEKFFIDYLLEEFKENKYLKQYQYNLDFDTLLELSMDYKKVLDLASLKTKKEILELLDFAENY